ncbi:TonB-dependent receptor [Qipengyuania sp.]|uniref:TonB-dependent receptor n=1 Tax=Qipengyuania sp. TaxID=2004515 RepID=UPI0035C7AE3D
MLYHSLTIRSALLGVSFCALIATAPLSAQTQPTDPAVKETDHGGDDVHDRRRDADNRIVVSAHGLRQLDLLAGTSVLEGEALQRNQSGQLGDVVAKLPGVTTSGFAPGVSRPVLRGFSGERVRTLIDGIGTIDASNTSDDHAVAVDPLTAERIEVLRGPAVLLYGSQAIGGAVNVVDKRIPRRIPSEPFHIDALGSFDSVNDQYQIAGSADAPLGGGFVVHADGSYREAGNVSIPGYVVSDDLRADLLADAAEEDSEGNLEEAAELRETANRRGELPNSQFETWSANAGFAFFEGDSSLGASVGWYDTSYGVPERPGAGHHHEDAGDGAAEEEEGPVTIGLHQFRADLRGQLDLGDGFFDKLMTRVGYTDYTHTEFEGAETGTVFDVQGIEARAELVQNASNPLRGSIGVQYYFRDFSAIGEEAFVAPNRTNQFALFALQEYGPGPLQLEGALRYENTQVDAVSLGLARNFDAFSGAVGVAYETAGGLRFGINGTRVERAPSGEELFANGPHIATQAFEIGNPDLAMETAWGAEAYVRGRLGPAEMHFAVSQSWFDNYIYLSETGEEEDELPVFAFLQDNAKYFSIEGQLTAPLIEGDAFTLLADVRGDYVDAELEDGSALPRIPPLSLLGALEAQTGPVDLRAEVQWFAKQDRVAAFETPTDGFTFVNASVAWHPVTGNNNVTLIAQVDNIFDVEGRRHSSFTKDFVPLAGRNFRVSARLSF